MILIIDNYDSFVYNIDRYLKRLKQKSVVVRNDAIGAEEIAASGFKAVVISPGPKTPTEAGCSLDVIRHCSGKVPILGICLGHQAIGEAFGGSIVRAPKPVHGQTSPIRHQGIDLFQGLPSPLQVARYHSLVIESKTLPQNLEVLATGEDGMIMAVRDRQRPVWGVQFHPESIMTQGGYQILRNFLELGGLDVPDELPVSDLVTENHVSGIGNDPDASELHAWWEQP
jgi:anthranilate synthase/aminodeoxychorismate synthase-like glutamine amidotransferase